MTKVFTSIILIIVLAYALDAQEIKDSVIVDSTDQIVLANSQTTQSDEINSKNPVPTPWWQWFLLGIFGSSGFGMLLNKRFAGIVVIGIVLTITIIKLKTALANNFEIWPFYILGGWVLLTANMAKNANNQVMGKKPQKRNYGTGANRLINLAFDEIDKKDYNRAKELLEESFKIDDKIPEGHSEYAFVLSILGFIDRAIEHMIKAALLQPKNAKFWSNLAFQYFNDKQYIKAMTATFLTEIIDPRYRSISESKKIISMEYISYNSYVEICKKRAEAIWKVINMPDDGLPIQSGDINQLMDPHVNFFL